MVIIIAVLILILYFGTIWVAMNLTEFLESKKIINDNNSNFVRICLILYVLETAILIQIFLL
jgi:hypothetical protein